MKMLKFGLFPLVVVVFSDIVEVQKDDFQSNMVWSWKTCASPGGKIVKAVTSPSSPTLGYDFTAALEVQLGPDTDLSKNGGNITGIAHAEIMGASKSFPILLKDVCSDLKVDKEFTLSLGHVTSEGVDCKKAVAGSTVTIKANSEISGVARFSVPSGGVSIKAMSDGVVFACAALDFHMTGWTKEMEDMLAKNQKERIQKIGAKKMRKEDHNKASKADQVLYI